MVYPLLAFVTKYAFHFVTQASFPSQKTLNCFSAHADKYYDITMSNERGCVADMSEPACVTSGLSTVVSSWPTADC